ncbi:MAG TPA: hypothetical protein PLQ14_06925 [Actinomycetota bacterium]|nr:hypothetical protein [Actinomycetota bacterium]HPQ84180.1 hypothetical protein [Actinomycetota bacterium]
MSYQSIAQAAQNLNLKLRIAACVATQPDVPDNWWPIPAADRLQWACAGEPGWGEAWESAVLNPDITDVGNNPGVITDAMILSAVQANIGLLTPPSGTSNPVT